ncbi:type I secretion system permease/ATPase [Fluoribacter gormanii]|uniref:ATP-binding cassette, subfamily C, LapB n=1 Tax=Fluoribacter gormanii TaxID=464 RepID=A0A377GF84_9GAMM|nr:type I secretion system permease/ATPase [Fluoribacter gormanii]KTD01681.1 toxin secretion ATP binding protein [Fluoribacter gormanii]MCW8444963.1 type I secretion system permease/ATPase [Fluoribacter gormanii]SIR92027.1 ATP-binding cassette, subfamily C, LapB [Fluoribacter gormanii]STO23470.1 RTX-I toxin determinant B [Fluoribacter gormanii]
MDKSNENKDTFSDPLLDCLVILTMLSHRPLSADVLRAGLPLENNRLTPALFIRAAERVGFSARVVKRSLSHISKLVLPVVLLLKNDQACILNKIIDSETVELILSDHGGGVQQKSLDDLEENYTGQAIFIAPVFKYETRSEAKPTERIDKLSWFWSTLSRYRYIYIQVILAAFLVNIFNLVMPLFIMNVYNRVIPNNANVTLWVLVIGVLMIHFFDFILRLLRGYLIDVSGKKADVVMASTLFQQAMSIRLMNKPNSVGAFVNNLREFEVLRDFFTSATLTTIIDLPFVILFFVLIAYLGSWLVLIPLIIVPLILLAAYILEKPMREAVLKSLQGAMQKHAILVETVTAIETVKSLNAEGQMQKKWEQYVGTTARDSLKMRYYSNLIITITNYGQQFITVGMIALGVYMIEEGSMSLGGLIATNILAGRILAPLSSLAGILTRLQQARLSLENLNHLMSLPVERPENKRFLHLPKIEGTIEFDKVSFQYPGQQILALDKVSFKIKAGERVAFIGRIGSGKSTIQRLLLGLYQPKEGNIYIDGINIEQLDPVDLRKNMGFVPQDSMLFYGTVRDNISMGMPWADDTAIINAGYLGGVDRFVNHHPEGFDMMVGERGEGLSGGQRQSIALARGLLSDPPIWLFDEPTSAMDMATEQETIQRLLSLKERKTIILVTHKVSLFPLVERLIMMDNGHIIIDGPKNEVIDVLQKAQALEKQKQSQQFSSSVPNQEGK